MRIPPSGNDFKHPNGPRIPSVGLIRGFFLESLKRFGGRRTIGKRRKTVPAFTPTSIPPRQPVLRPHWFSPIVEGDRVVRHVLPLKWIAILLICGFSSVAGAAIVSIDAVGAPELTGSWEQKFSISGKDVQFTSFGVKRIGAQPFKSQAIQEGDETWNAKNWLSLESGPSSDHIDVRMRMAMPWTLSPRNSISPGALTRTLISRLRCFTMATAWKKAI